MQKDQQKKKETPKASIATVLFAYILAVLFPPFGFLSGITLMARKRIKNGVIVTLISITVLMLIALPMYRT